MSGARTSIAALGKINNRFAFSEASALETDNNDPLRVGSDMEAMALRVRKQCLETAILSWAGACSRKGLGDWPKVS